MFGHAVRGPLAVLQDDWKAPAPPVNLLDYVNGFRRRLYEAGKMAKQKLENSQSKMKRLFDRRAECRELSPGDQVLALLPIVGSPFQAKFTGPYSVVRKVSDLNYVVATPDRRRSTQLCHINLLKPYYVRSSVLAATPEVKPVALAAGVGGSGPLPALMATGVEEELTSPDDGMLRGRLRNSESLSKLDLLLGHLADSQRVELEEVIKEFPELFGDTPSRTHLVQHDVDVGDAEPIRQRFYRVSPEKREQLDSEVEYMLTNNIAVPSHSSWASPCLLVKKPDNTFRPCTDYRKVNAVTRADSYPLTSHGGLC